MRARRDLLLACEDRCRYGVGEPLGESGEASLRELLDDARPALLGVVGVGCEVADHLRIDELLREAPHRPAKTAHQRAGCERRAPAFRHERLEHERLAMEDGAWPPMRE